MRGEPDTSQTMDGLEPDNQCLTADGRWGCRICSKSFARRAHLKRHLENHLVEPRHRCNVCGKAYARSDVLARHFTIAHASATGREWKSEESTGQQGLADDPPSASTSGQSLGKRIRLTPCTRCIALQLSCNGERPCGICSSLSGDQSVRCEAEEGPARTDDRAAFAIMTSASAGTSLTEVLRHSGDHPHVRSSPTSVWSLPNSSQASSPRGVVGLPTHPAASSSTSMELGVPRGPRGTSHQAGEPDKALLWTPHPGHVGAALAAEPHTSLQSTTFRPDAGLAGLPDQFDDSTFDWLFNAQPDAGWPGGPASLTPSLTVGDSVPSRGHSVPPVPTSHQRYPGGHTEPPIAASTVQLGLGESPLTDPTSQSTAIPTAERQQKQEHPPWTSQIGHRWPDETIDIPPTHDNILTPVFFYNIDARLLASEDFRQVARLTEQGRQRILTLPAMMAEVSNEQSCAADVALNSTEVSVLNAFVQLYFQYHDVTYPMVHKATFDPQNCPAFLLGAICAVGAMHSSIPGAQDFALMLMTVVNRAIFNILPHDNRLMKSIEYAQALLLNFNFFRSAGKHRMLELAEAARSPLMTIIRKNRFFDAETTCSEGATPDQAWLTWVRVETGIRTAWCCFSSDIELSAVWQLTPVLSLDEAVARLPQDDELWRASNSEEWAQIKSTRAKAPVYLTQLHELLGSCQNPSAIQDRLHAAGVSVRQWTLLAYSLCSLSIGLRSIHISCLHQTRQKMLEEFNLRCISFCKAAVLAHQTDSVAERGDFGHSGAPSTAEAIARFTLLRGCLDFGQVQVMSGKTGSRGEMRLALEQVRTSMSRRPWDLVAGTAHAGRIVYLCSSGAVESSYEAFFLFYATTMLFVAAKTWPRPAPLATQDPTTRMHPDAARGLTGPIQIDGSRPTYLDETVWQSHEAGERYRTAAMADVQRSNISHMQPTLSCIGSLTHFEAPRRLLDYFAHKLASRPKSHPWPIEPLLSSILSEMSFVFSS